MNDGDSRYFDFDAMIAEAQTETNPPKFKYRGKEYILPDKMPAMLVLKLLRMKNADKSIDDESFINDMHLIFDSLLGIQFDELLTTGLSIEDLAMLLQNIVGLYQGNMETPPADQTVTG